MFGMPSWKIENSKKVDEVKTQCSMHIIFLAVENSKTKKNSYTCDVSSDFRILRIFFFNWAYFSLNPCILSSLVFLLE